MGVPHLGLRLIASAVAIVTALALLALLLQGIALAPRRSLLGALPIAGGAVVHAVLVLAYAWWMQPVRAVRAVLATLVLVGGMVLVAGGTDAAATQLRRANLGGPFEGYAVVAGALVAAQGALAILLVWAARAPVLSPPRPKRPRSPWSRRDDYLDR